MVVNDEDEHPPKEIKPGQHANYLPPPSAALIVSASSRRRRKSPGASLTPYVLATTTAVHNGMPRLAVGEAGERLVERGRQRAGR